MPAYFLPLKAGSKKKWGSKREDFWCCHGTTVQAHTLYPELCWYEEDKRIIIAQYINSEYKHSENVTVTQNVDMKYYNTGALFDEHDNSRTSRWFLKINVSAKTPEEFTLSLRIPDWVCGKPVISVNGKETECSADSDYCDIKRVWGNDTVNVYFPAALSAQALPDFPKLTAFLEGPIVLAGLSRCDCGIMVQNGSVPTSALANVTEHTYSTFPWQQSTYRTVGQPENFDFIPLYDITDEEYTVYFTVK